MVIFHVSFLINPCFAQDNTYLSFDENKLPFRNIVQYVFRGHEYYYYQTFQSVREYVNYYKDHGLDVTYNLKGMASHNSPLRLDDIDTIPRASSVTLYCGVTYSGFSFRGFFQSREFEYFSYKRKYVKKDDPNTYIESHLGTGIKAYLIGYNTTWVSAFVSYNELVSFHTLDINYQELPKSFQNLYLSRYSEIQKKLNDQNIFLGEDPYVQKNYSFLFYSNPFDIGGIFAKGYQYYDANYAYLLNLNRYDDFNSLLDFSLINLRILKTVDKLLRLRITTLVNYNLKMYFSNNYLKEYNKTHSDLEIDLSVGSFRKYMGKKRSLPYDFGYRYNIVYDHKNRLKSFSHNEYFFNLIWGENSGILKISYCSEYTNPKSFMPDIDQIYNNISWVNVTLTAIIPDNFRL